MTSYAELWLFVLQSNGFIEDITGKNNHSKINISSSHRKWGENMSSIYCSDNRFQNAIVRITASFKRPQCSFSNILWLKPMKRYHLTIWNSRVCNFPIMKQIETKPNRNNRCYIWRFPINTIPHCDTLQHHYKACDQALCHKRLLTRILLSLTTFPCFRVFSWRNSLCSLILEDCFSRRP